MIDIHESYKLESQDRKHRPAEFLKQQHQKWKKLNVDVDFFDWLDAIEKAKKIPVAPIYYADATQKKYYQLAFQQELVRDKSGVYDTTAYLGKKPGYAAYAISLEGKLYAANPVKNHTHHSTFVAGESVICAGLIKIVNGKITDISNRSGHYKPGLKNLVDAINMLPKEVFAKNATVSYERLRFPWLVNKLTISDFKLLRAIGRGLDRLIATKTLSLQQFIEYAKSQPEMRKQLQDSTAENSNIKRFVLSPSPITTNNASIPTVKADAAILTMEAPAPTRKKGHSLRIVHP